MDKLTFHLSVDEINIVLTALGELPAKTSLGVIQTLQTQAQQQRAQQTEKQE